MPDITEMNKEPKSENSDKNALEHDKKKTVSTKIKARDIALGFFGWIIFHNLLFVLTINVALWLFIALVFLGAVILPIILYSKKRIWVSTGIISAVIINAGAWIVLADSIINSGIEISMLFAVLFPFPLGGVLTSQ